VPIKDKPETPPKRVKKSLKRIRPADSSLEVPRTIITQRQVKIRRLEKGIEFNILNNIEEFKSVTDIIKDTKEKGEGKAERKAERKAEEKIKEKVN